MEGKAWRRPMSSKCFLLYLKCYQPLSTSTTTTKVEVMWKVEVAYFNFTTLLLLLLPYHPTFLLLHSVWKSLIPSHYVLELTHGGNLRMVCVCQQTDTQPIVNKLTQPLWDILGDSETLCVFTNLLLHIIPKFEVL